MPSIANSIGFGCLTYYYASYNAVEKTLAVATRFLRSIILLAGLFAAVAQSTNVQWGVLLS